MKRYMNIAIIGVFVGAVGICVAFGQRWPLIHDRIHHETVAADVAKIEAWERATGHVFKIGKPWPEDLRDQALEVRRIYYAERAKLWKLVPYATPKQEKVLRRMMREQRRVFLEEMKRLSGLRSRRSR